MLNSRRYYVIASSCWLTLILLGCQPDQARSVATEEIRMHLASEPATIHPFNSGLGAKTIILDYVFQQLLTIDLHTGKVVPQLLADLPTLAEDGLTYHCRLHPQAAWPDGRPITSEDVAFSLKALACPLVENPQAKPYAEYLVDIKLDPQDPKQFQLVMQEYYMHNDNFGVFGYIIDPQRYDSTGALDAYTLAQMIADSTILTDSALINWAATFNDAANGTEVERLNGGSGPYQLMDWESGRSISLTRNPTYWGKNLEGWMHAQDVEKLSFQFLSDPQQAELALRRGELDVTRYLPQGIVERLEADSTVMEEFLVSRENRTSVVFLSLNNKADGFKHPAFLRNKQVRQALSLSLPLDRIVNEELNLGASRTASPVSKGNQLYHSELGLVAYDPDSAKALLTRAGWVDSDGDGIRDKVVNGKLQPLSFSLLHQPKPALIPDMMGMLQQAWRKVGVDCKLEVMDQRTYRGKYVFTGDYDAALMTLGAPPLPYEFRQIWHGDEYPNGYNFMGFDNPRADSLMEALRVEPDVSKRQQMAYEVQEIIKDEQPVIFLYVPTARIVARRDVFEGRILSYNPYVWMADLSDAVK